MARVPDPETPERQLSEFEQRRRLQLAMDELPPEQREVLQLRLEPLAKDSVAHIRTPAGVFAGRDHLLTIWPMRGLP